MLWYLLSFLLLNNPVFAAESTPSATVVINKFQYYPPSTTKKEWVELYNSTDQEIDLNGWILTDEKNNNKSLDGLKIPIKGSTIFYDGDSWLNNDFDTIFLKIGNSEIDKVKYKVVGKKITINDSVVLESNSDLKWKWIGRSPDGSNNWQVFADTEGPVSGGINYFDGYKTVVENIGVTIIPAIDQSGIGTTLVITKVANLLNNDCINFVVDVGNSLVDGKCYKFEYVAPDGVGNTSTFVSNSTVKFDTSKPIFSFDNAFRNILKLRSTFGGIDPESGVLKYKYSLSNLNCGSTIVPSDWSYIYNSILNIGYSGEPMAIYGKTINNALLESDNSCIDFATDIIAPKIIKQNNSATGLYKIGDKLNFSFEFDEDIEIDGDNYLINLNTGSAKFINKTGNILNFEYEVLENDLTNNLAVGETKIIVNGGEITDMAGNNADLAINNLENGIGIDGVKPTINLIGETFVEIPQFGTYFDLGATSSDGNIAIENNVNTNLGGIYEVKYTATDDAGNISEISRKVKVIDTTAPTIEQLSITNYELRIKSSESGFVEWEGKCEGVNNNLVMGSNIIKIKTDGDGVYDDCEIRAWDKWGNVGLWQKINSFIVDTTAPLISFVNSSQTEIAITANENLKECNWEKENIISGDFETGNIDGWQGDWITDNLHFARGSWSAKSPTLVNDDLVEKSIWQKISMESGGKLSFWWRVSSEKDWDYLRFYIDGDLIAKISGEVSWQEIKRDLAVGNHIIKFTYSKDYSSESGEDAGWIDNIKVDGGRSINSMNIADNTASINLDNLSGGSNKYIVSCSDMYDNKSETIEREIIKNTEKVNEDNTPTPTPYTIFKTSAIVPTVKMVKPTIAKTTVKKSPSVLGIAITPTPKTTATTPPTLKLKSSIPWGEIKFWTTGMAVLGITSVIILIP